MNPQTILDAVLAQYPEFVRDAIHSDNRQPTVVEARFVIGTMLLIEGNMSGRKVCDFFNKDRTWMYPLFKFPDTNPRLIAARKTLASRLVS